MILVPQNAKILCNIANHDHTMTHARPFESNDGASYQINGKIATSKGGEKEHLRPFE